MKLQNRLTLACLAVTIALALAASISVAADDAWAAKLASVQNEVQTRKAGSDSWKPSERNELLYSRDRLRTGAASRAAILYSDQTLHRINEKSEIEVQPPKADDPGVLRVISGKHYFSSRQPKDYGRIETPTVTAAIRGTEFAVDVADDGTTLITMLEGVVDASNEFGDVRVVAGEAAYVEPGKSPVKQIVVRPEDAVTWSLYYPSVLGGADAGRLEAMGAEGNDLSRAADLLSAGQLSQAEPLIEAVLGKSPDNPIALALSSVIDIVADRKQEAMDKARRAVDADPDSPAAALALSMAYQAGFEIERAREMAETAVRLDSRNTEALARLAELRMAEGNIDGARKAADQAVLRDENSVRALSVLGFVELAELDTNAAMETFRRAVELDPNFPMARLGNGIATFRKDAEAGREEMQAAAIVDPENSLFRSYLGKVYFEEDRPDAAAKEFAAAKRLDPSDPTPFLYDAILKQTYNKPVEALKDLQQSIELNDNRAVYRSRLLLDQDLAVRSADLARIYNELGFGQLGLVTARKSADLDQSNYSAHLFLAGTYRNLPFYAPAFLSETLQARIYQPVSVNAVRPDVVNEGASFNEYTSLFDRPRKRAFATGTVGFTDKNIYPSGDMCVISNSPAPVVVPCDEVETKRNSYAGEATLSMNGDRFAGAITFRTSDDDGFRPNSDADTDTVRGLLIFAPTHKDKFQVNIIDGDRTSGDLPLRGFPSLVPFGQTRIDTDLTNIGLGYHRVVSPAADLAISAIYSETVQSSLNQFSSALSTGTIEGNQLEAQYVHRRKHVIWTVGAGRYNGDQKIESGLAAAPPTARFKGDDEFLNGYVYAKFASLGPLSITAGAAYEDVQAPLGLLPPRDSLFGISEDVDHDASQVSGKLGLSLQVTPETVVRVAGYERLTPAIGRLQTLEPTQVAGFNQFFRDRAGTSSGNFSIGLDHQVGDNVFLGLSLVQRNLDVPEAFCSAPDALFGLGCSNQTVDTVVMRESDDLLAEFYLNAALGKRVAASVEYAYEGRDFDYTQRSNNFFYEDDTETHRIRPQLRWFLPTGFYASLRGTHFDQQVDQFESFDTSVMPPTEPDEMTRNVIKRDFWIGDVEVGYQLPNRMSVRLQVLNFSDREYDFYRSALEEDVIPARRTLLTFNVSTR